MIQSTPPIKDITPQQLREMLAQDHPPLVLDVRETTELDICKLPHSIHIPLGNLPQEIDRLPVDQTIVTLCHHGRRSFQAALFLKNRGYSCVLNLAGGIHAWAEQIDPKMKQY